jgi:SAM-dependent methyltransferase
MTEETPAQRWDARYDTPDYRFGTEPNGFLVSVADRLPSGDALCLAEGEGRNAVYLAGLGYDVTAVDASKVGLAKAERLAAERGVSIRTIVADLEDHRIEPDAWDVIVLTFAHLEPGLRKRVHRASVRALRPGGALVLEAYTPAQVELGTGGPPTPERLMTLNDLRAELSELRFEIGREVHRELSEGSAHNGVGAVVQVLAFKPSERQSDLRRSKP